MCNWKAAIRFDVWIFEARVSRLPGCVENLVRLNARRSRAIQGFGGLSQNASLAPTNLTEFETGDAVNTVVSNFRR